MAKQRRKKAVKQSSKKENKNEDNDNAITEYENEAFLDQEVERQCAAARAIRDIEVEHLLTAIRLLRSYFDERQQQTPVRQFFKENLPNLSLVKNEENGLIEAKWDNADGNISMSHADGTDLHASLLQRLSLGYSAGYHTMQPFSRFDFPTEAVGASFTGSDILLSRDSLLQGPSESDMLRFQDALQTPGATSQRLSIGMTPKTRRLPKPGEILLSVHGSPLGVFKEDNMGAIQEIEEGSERP